MNGNYVEAINCYTKAIELSHLNPVFYSNSKECLSVISIGAQAYIQLGDYAKAIEDCDSALQLDPKHIKVSVRL